MPRDESLDAYLATVDRLEPNITPIDVTGAAASIAISLKRIADILQWFQERKIQEENDKR